MKCIIAGSRTIKSPQVVYAAMRACPFVLDVTEVVSGRARGVDMLGEVWARAHKLPVAPFPARWRDSDGSVNPRAGFERNERMAGYADALVAVWDGESSGTKDMIARARKHGLEVFVWNQGDAGAQVGP